MKTILTTISVILPLLLLSILIVKLYHDRNSVEEPKVIIKTVYIEVTPTSNNGNVPPPPPCGVEWPCEAPPPPTPTPTPTITITPTTTIRPTTITIIPTVAAPTIVATNTPTPTVQRRFGNEEFNKYVDKWKEDHPNEAPNVALLWDEKYNPIPTRTPRPTPTPNPWIETFKQVGGWCYLTKTNQITNEVLEVPRQQIIFWDYHNNGIETPYNVKCLPKNGVEVCNSTMTPTMFKTWYTKFGLNIENQEYRYRKGCNID